MKRIVSAVLMCVLMFCFCADALAAGAKTETISLTPVKWDKATVAQCVVPKGYKLKTKVRCCDKTTCLGYPIHLQVTVSSSKKKTSMVYFCGEQYIERVKSGFFKQRDGKLDSQTAIFMKKYKNAADYCDELAKSLQKGAKFWKKENMSFYNQRKDGRLKDFRKTIQPEMKKNGMNLDWVKMTAAQRTYTYKKDGETYCLCILAEVRAYQYYMKTFMGKETTILWDVPGYYVLRCPKSAYKEMVNGLFKTFAENTVVNDQFIKMSDKLTESIAQKVIRQMNMAVAASSAYAQAMTALTFSMVEGQMNRPTYSSDRFSDYIFDRNDYTLSDGSSVKISTAYDYVYETSNGSIIYSNSAFTDPGGATRLYPNR